jgi:hypothetical protein
VQKFTDSATSSLYSPSAKNTRLGAFHLLGTRKPETRNRRFFQNNLRLLSERFEGGQMNGDTRMSWLYDLARAQTDHEEAISSELSTRAGLLAALVALVVAGITESWHFYGRSNWLIVACALLAGGVFLLAVASVGLEYARPGSARAWEKWADVEVENGRVKTDVDSELLSSLYDDYATCAEMGMKANEAKAPLLNWATVCVLCSILCLLGALVWR